TPAHPMKAFRPESRSSSLIEETTLEDALTAEMVDRLAQSVADEPIPLEVRKLPRPEPEAPTPDPRTPRSAIPAEVVSFGRRPVGTPGPPEAAPPQQAPEPETDAGDAGDFVLEEMPTEPG